MTASGYGALFLFAAINCPPPSEVLDAMYQPERVQQDGLSYHDREWGPIFGFSPDMRHVTIHVNFSGDEEAWTPRLELRLEESRILEVERWDGDGAFTERIVNQYDDLGRLTQVAYYNQESASAPTTIQRYNYSLSGNVEAIMVSGGEHGRRETSYAWLPDGRMAGIVAQFNGEDVWSANIEYLEGGVSHVLVSHGTSARARDCGVVRVEDVGGYRRISFVLGDRERLLKEQVCADAQPPFIERSFTESGALLETKLLTFSSNRELLRASRAPSGLSSEVLTDVMYGIDGRLVMRYEDYGGMIVVESYAYESDERGNWIHCVVERVTTPKPAGSGIVCQRWALRRVIEYAP